MVEPNKSVTLFFLSYLLAMHHNAVWRPGSPGVLQGYAHLLWMEMPYMEQVNMARTS